MSLGFTAAPGLASWLLQVIIISNFPTLNIFNITKQAIAIGGDHVIRKKGFMTCYRRMAKKIQTQ